MKSYRECFEFVRTASQWIAKHEEESKFKYSLNKVNRKLGRVQEKWQELIEEINIEHCASDKEGVILRDEHGQYKYTKEELLKRNKEVSALYNQEINIEPHFASEVPEDLGFLEREVFTGFVIQSEEENLKVV